MMKKINLKNLIETIIENLGDEHALTVLLHLNTACFSEEDQQFIEEKIKELSNIIW